MIHYSDEAILEGLRLRSDYIINFIYKEYYPLIRFLVSENGGTAEDAEDTFQDGIVIIYNKISLNIFINASFTLIWLCIFKAKCVIHIFV